MSTAASDKMSAAKTNRSLAEMMDELSRFDGPPDSFLRKLLRRQCAIGQAAAGAIIRHNAVGDPEVLAIHPQLREGDKSPVWLSFAFEQADRVAKQGLTLIQPMRDPGTVYGGQARQHLVFVPLQGKGEVRGTAAFLVDSADIALVNEASRRIELTVSMIGLYEMRLTVDRSTSNLARMGQVVEVVAAINEHKHLQAAAMAMCNHIASQWSADRVSIGFLHGRAVRLAAMSHTNRISRKMKLVQAVETAMEEAIDQDLEIAYPAHSEAQYVCRAASDLSAKYGPTTVLSVPLRREGEPMAVLTIERPMDKPFELVEIETLRLLGDVCTARLHDLYKHDRWFGAKMLDAAREGASLLVGAKHTWAKVLAAAFILFAAYMTFATGTYRVESTFVLEASQRRVVSAPFDGYLDNANVRAGDDVIGGKTVLASLITTDMEMQLLEAESQRMVFLKQAELARGEQKTVEMQVHQAEADKLEARIQQLEKQIERAAMISPIDGVVLIGDLHEQEGAKVSTGDVLFEIAPLEDMRATLYVPEDRIADVESGQTGELASASHPGQYLPFMVETINPVAEVVGGRNVFRVRVTLAETQPWLRPGMEGIAKIDIAEKKLGWIWSRQIINWLRMKLWV